MKTASVAGVILASVAIGTCLLLGTFGWFAVGFGVMTDCTDDYGCSSTGCSPCANAGRWINLGGITQLVLAGAGFAVLVRAWRAKRARHLSLWGAALLAASVLIVAGTTWRAQDSYCQPGTAGYARSYCSR